MRLKIVRISANPKGYVESRKVPTSQIIGREENVTDGEVPIVINIIDEVVYDLGSGLIGMDLCNFHIAGEECCVGAGQFIAQLDREADRAGIGNAFVVRNVSRAA